MALTFDTADQIYTVLTQMIDAPEIDYLRWAFKYAIAEVKVESYLLDSTLGHGARFHNNERPTVRCAKGQDNILRRRLTERVNGMIAEIVEIDQPKPAKVHRRVRIRGTTKRVAIPVLQVPSPEQAANYLRD